MKKVILSIFLWLFTACFSVMGQHAQNAIVVKFGYTMPSFQKKILWDGRPNYHESFNKLDIAACYEAFMWRHMFIQPEISLWYSNNYNDGLVLFKGLNGTGLPDGFDNMIDKKKAWQAGATIDVMGAWRVPLRDNFSIDFLTGPMIDVCFASRVKGLGLEYKNFYRTVTFDWRVGVAFNIRNHMRIGANLDLRPGNHKTVDTGEKYVYFIPSGESRRDALNFSLGYRF